MTNFFGTYEILGRLGAGGGGVVYLANHKGLNKKVVLKADKRKITAHPDILRREVDVLKDLHHTYIPQVYDFFSNQEIVYTVMEYIEGESLDKPLKRGETFSQPQVIDWAIQVLEALQYLHSPEHGNPPRGYVHSDIKPANLMLRPNGNICLIDFNIALAIGEQNLVGYSEGYASPEHYGQDYTSFGTSRNSYGETTALIDSKHAARNKLKKRREEMTVLCGSEDADAKDKDVSGTASTRKVMPDVRSDIYSLGATLYHLLSGSRPAKYAVDVVPLSTEEFSPPLVDIITKAMEPDPDLRFQSAWEMLDAFLKIHENDPRWKRLRHNRKIARTSLMSFFLAGCIMAFAGLKQMENEQSQAAMEAKISEEAAKRSEEEARRAEEAARLAEEQAKQAEESERLAKDILAAVREGESAYNRGDIKTALNLAKDAVAVDTPYKAEAQKLLTDALGVYDLTDGLKPHRVTALPSEPLKLAISPDGRKTAVLYAYCVALVNTETGEILMELPSQPTATADLVFLDNTRLLYAGENGITAINLNDGGILWQGETVTAIAVSMSGEYAVGVNRSEPYALVYRTDTGEKIQTVPFDGRKQKLPAGGGILADTEDSLLALNEDGRFLAVSFEDGGLFLYDLQEDAEYRVLDTSDYTHFEGGFYHHYFAFSAWNDAKSIFLVYDMDTMKQTGGFSGKMPFLTKSDDRGIYVTSGNLLVQLNPVTGEQQELAYASADILKFERGSNGYVLTFARDGTYALYDSAAAVTAKGSYKTGSGFLATAGSYVALANRETPEIKILKLETYEDAVAGIYDRAIPHAEARFSADEETMMLFRYNCFSVLSPEGELIAKLDIPEDGKVYDQQFRREEKDSWLEVTYEDGYVRNYSAKDGSLVSEYQGAVPDGSLTETFETSRWEIVAPLHGTPVVYDRENGEKHTELEKDSYLTYVVETDSYIITQYLSAQGEPYGLLLDKNLKTLAYLPNLCDVIGEKLFFDDGKGCIKQSSVYSVEELAALAEQELNPLLRTKGH